MFSREITNEFSIVFRISICKLYERFGSIPIYREMIRERLRWPGPVLWMKDRNLPNIVLVPTSKIKSSLKEMENATRNYIRKMGTFGEGMK